MAASRLSGKRRLAIAGGALLAAGALLTAAAFSDVANINLFGSKDKEGVGNKTFELLTQNAAPPKDNFGVFGDGTWIRANTDAGIDWVIPRGDQFEGTRFVSIPLKNGVKGSGVGTPIKIKLTIETIPGKTDDPVIREHMSYWMMVYVAGKGVASINIANAEASKGGVVMVEKLPPGVDARVDINVRDLNQDWDSHPNRELFPRLKFTAEPV